MNDYTTRNRSKALALFTALFNAEVPVNLINHGDHFHIVHHATPVQFATIRASIGIPSSNTPDMPDPNTVVIPDHIPFD